MSDIRLSVSWNGDSWRLSKLLEEAGAVVDYAGSPFATYETVSVSIPQSVDPLPVIQKIRNIPGVTRLWMAVPIPLEGT